MRKGKWLMDKYLSYIRVLLLTIGLFVAGDSLSQIKPVSITAIDSLMIREAKPILILLTTEWCRYCHMQKAQIQKNKTLNQRASNFYYVEFDAESRNSVSFHGATYSYKPTGYHIGTHELAQKLNGSGKLTFPTWVLLDADYQPLFLHKGVLLPKELNRLAEALQKTK